MHYEKGKDETAVITMAPQCYRGLHP